MHLYHCIKTIQKMLPVENSVSVKTEDLDWCLWVHRWKVFTCYKRIHWYRFFGVGQLDDRSLVQLSDHLRTNKKLKRINERTLSQCPLSTDRYRTSTASLRSLFQYLTSWHRFCPVLSLTLPGTLMCHSHPAVSDQEQSPAAPFAPLPHRTAESNEVTSGPLLLLTAQPKYP